MAIQLTGKGLQINGLDVPGFTIITGLAANVEAALVQGGDATALNQAPGLVPAFYTVVGGVATLLKPDGTAFSGGAGLDNTTYTATQLDLLVSAGTTPTPAPSGSFPKLVAASDNALKSYLISSPTAAQRINDPNVSGYDAGTDALKVREVGDSYESVTTLNADVTLGTTGALGDYLRDLHVVIATAASDVVLKDNGVAVHTYPSLPIGTYRFPIKRRSLAGPWAVRISNASATNSNLLATGKLT